jgi:rhodanese-related sulfurtransferase
MKWMQFFTPAPSITWEEAHQLADQTPERDVTFLDVRQPKEYLRGHLPGAKLIPLGELENRLAELAPDKAVVIY